MVAETQRLVKRENKNRRTYAYRVRRSLYLLSPFLLSFDPIDRQNP